VEQSDAREPVWCGVVWCGVSTGAYRGMKGGRVRIGVTLPEPAGDLTTAAHSGMFVAKSKTASDLSSRLTAS
jgi:hypothetical protein